MKLHWQILISLLLGAVVGILLPEAAGYTNWVGDLFMNALSMLVVPIIFFSIVTSVAGIAGGGGEGLKKLGAKTIGLYVLTMVIAIATGLVLVNLIRPGTGVVAGAAAIPQGALESPSVVEIVTGFVPKNIFYAFTQNYTLPVILLAFLFGLNVNRISAKSSKVLTSFFDAGLELTMRIVEIVIRLSPIGIFAIILKQFSLAGDIWVLLQNMAMYVVTVAAGLCIHTFVWLPLMLRGFGVRPWSHFRNMSTPLLTAFSTASSGAALPATMHAVEHNDGVSPRITKFTIPLGSAINMDGAALLECVAVIFIAQAYGVELGIYQQILVAATSLLCAVGSAGIPMAALVMMAIILNVVGLPLEGIGLVVGVDRILDMMRTAVNVYGDTCVSVMVAKSEGEQLKIDKKRKNE